MKYAYYPGCSGHGTSVEYEASTRAVCNALNMDLVEIEDWNCCGSTPAHSVSHELSGALAARNLMQAAKTGADCVISPCPSCSSNLKMARYRMQNPAFKAGVDELLDAPTPANAEGGADLMETYSVLQAIVEHVGVENVASRVTYPLEGVKVVTYYGCLLSARQFRINHRMLIEGLRKKFERTGDKKLSIIPIHLNVDSEHNFPTRSEPVSQGSSQTIVRQSNARHPAPAGYRQVGDAISAWINGKIVELGSNIKE